jgi:hypothetical protein
VVVRAASGHREVPVADPGALDESRTDGKTISLDEQTYVSPDGKVELARITSAFRVDVAPTASVLERVDRAAMADIEEGTKHVSDTRHFEGDILVSESRDDANGQLVVQRKLYAADASRVVHMFLIVCAGPAEQLGPCEKAQQSMQLAVPNQLALADRPTSHAPNKTRLWARRVFGILGPVGLVVLLVVWKWPIFRRRKPGK